MRCGWDARSDMKNLVFAIALCAAFSAACRSASAAGLAAAEAAYASFRDVPGVTEEEKSANYPVNFYNEYDNAFQGAFFEMLERIEAADVTC